MSYEEANVVCDECDGDMTHLDNIYCIDCYNGLQDEIVEMQKIIDKLQEEIVLLEAKE